MGEKEKDPVDADGSLSDQDLDEAAGGLTVPLPPSGPVPLPYPNVSSADDTSAKKKSR